MLLTKKVKTFLGVIVILFALYAIKEDIYLPEITNESHAEYLQYSAIDYNESFDLRIIVLVANRSKSLLRLLNSLNAALYMNDNIAINIWIDRSVDGKYDIETYHIANAFQFLHGKKYVNVQSRHAGIFRQWIYTWNINDNSSEIAVILEDDIEVSPLFYRWLKLVHVKYDRYKNINGYSLHGTCENHDFYSTKKSVIEVPKKNTVFLYPALNTWGFSPNKKHWTNFVNWASLELKNKAFKPFVPNIYPTLWYKVALSKGTELNNWDMWHSYHAYLKQLFTMFPNIPGDLGFSIHWKEQGLHYGENKSKTPSGELMFHWIPQIESLPDHPIYLDYTGNPVNYTEL